MDETKLFASLDRLTLQDCNSCLQAGKPGCEVLCRTCGAALRSLRTAGREGPFGAFGKAVDRTA